MYGYIASMRTKPGLRDEVVALLLEGLDGLRATGCRSYVVSACATDEDRIWVTEVWESAEHHAASLQLPETRAAIARAMPMLTGEFTSQESQVVGGLGLGHTASPNTREDAASRR
ncbi:putative quinol monooxygenase [Pseudonocardia sp. MH-G8]|uniref:putative quinol monooxygenase n=1 Tax=Pseudonocardia sp. MH-G8 TaxID=1854588 RepID=UPI000BA0FBDC|nr:putative quinol monooxygenase [Pseudonocardia sp. MH-G8]OZM82278.1 antibiotic biosynthesis monooxygenase [Pseudonocardia sp. MH-G8]